MLKTCSIPECSGPYFSKGWCSMHYGRNYRHGDPLYVPDRGAKRYRPVNCKVEDCGPASKIRKGYCNKHYESFKTYGDPLASRTNRKYDYSRSPLERFWEKVDKSAEENGCWTWTGGHNGRKNKNQKYGSFHPTQGVKARVHRYSYELHHGVTLTSAEPVHHTCGNTLCVQPKHLQVITPQENTAEMLERTFYKRRIAQLEAELAEFRLKEAS